MLDQLIADAVSIAITPVAYTEAQGFALDVAKDFPNASIFVTGHSLGGGIAQFIASQQQTAGLVAGGSTFGAPGAAHLLPAGASSNVNNYRNSGDPVATLFAQVGTTTSTPGGTDQPYGLNQHTLDSYADNLGLNRPPENPGSGLSLTNAQDLAGILGFVEGSQYPLALEGPVGIVMGIAVAAAAALVIAALVDPIIIDLAGTGLNLTSLAQSGVEFSYTGDFAEQTSWIGAGTGFLVSLSPDGLVHDGSNLISNFSQLALFDIDGSGSILGAELTKLAVWQDMNGDGVCQQGEVHTLAELGVVEISLITRPSGSLIAGDTVQEVAIAKMANGSTRTVAAVGLSVNPVNTSYVGDYSIPSNLQNLPDLRGYGTLPSLHVSASLNAALQMDLSALISSNPGEISTFDQALESLLYEWAGATSSTSNGGELVDEQKLTFLQEYLNKHSEFFGAPVAAASTVSRLSTVLRRSSLFNLLAQVVAALKAGSAASRCDTNIRS